MESNKNQSDKTVRVGVIGVGYLGKIHAQIYKRMPNVELVGVVDTHEAAAKKVAEDCECEAWTNISDIIDKIDAVSIVVPTGLHLEVAKPFLERNIHMLLEKPIAPSFEESEELVELAEKSGVVFQVGHLERYNAGVMALAERAKEPRFIEVHRLGPFVARATDVDVITDLMIHDTELLKEAIRVGMIYAEKRGVAKFDKNDSAKEKIEYVYRLLAHDKLIQPLAKAQLDIQHMKHKLALWITKQLPADHPLLK